MKKFASNTILFICSALRKSISSEIANFIEDYKHLKFPSITKQGFSKARQNISPQAFAELCRLFVDKFYSLNNKLATWNGFNILAIDGTSLQVPDTKECGEYFGLSSNQNKTRTAVATASALYDVLNDIIVGARITKYRTSERKIAIANDNKNKGLKSKYQANKNFILGQVFINIINLITKSRNRKKTLNNLIEKAIKIHSQVKSNRSCERKNKHPRKKHHHNIKSCI